MGSVRDDVVLRAGVERADRDHTGIERADLARHDRLQGDDDARADDDRIDRRLRISAVSPLSEDLDVDRIGAGQRRARGVADLPGR